jgi:hypothetical protein
MDSEPKSKTGLEEYSSKTGFKERTLDPSVFDMV